MRLYMLPRDGDNGAVEITIDRASTVPVDRQIVEVIRAGVMDGRLPEGALLPPERIEEGVRRLAAAARELLAREAVALAG